MKPLLKIALVIGGYVGAFLAASAAVVVNDARMDPITQQSGMAAGGDMILWLGVFALASVPATGAGLFFLRPYQKFWRILCLLSLIVAGTAVFAAVGYLLHAAPGSPLYYWTAGAVLRLLMTPMLGLAFLVCCAFAPGRTFRLQLLAATLCEGVGLAAFALGMARSFVR
jgi:hypothetical protein